MKAKPAALIDCRTYKSRANNLIDKQYKSVSRF